MKWAMRYLTVILFFTFWVGGVVLAKGFWSTVASIFCFPWAFYLMMERIMQMTGFI